MATDVHSTGKRTVLLTGASGLLGHWLARTKPDDVRLVAVRHRQRVPDLPEVQADLRDAHATMEAVTRAEPALIIHAAYAKDRAAIVDATEHVVAAAGAVGADLVAISTDVVFSGDGLPRDEGSELDPVSDYGQWKAEAEGIARGSAGAAIVRLPLLVSFDPDDHVVREIRAGAARGETTQWFTDEVRQPVWTREVAAALWRIAALTAGEREGIWHLAGPERLTRFDIALRIVDHLGIDRNVIEAATTPAELIRPRDVAFTDTRARAEISWYPTPVIR